MPDAKQDHPNTERDERVTTNSDEERIAQIRERHCPMTHRECPTPKWQMRQDIDFLLSLLDRQAADHARPAGWQDAMQRADPCKVFITFETREHAEAFLRGLQPAESANDAATRMREACVVKVKVWANEHKHAFVGHVIDELYKELESEDVQQTS